MRHINLKVARNLSMMQLIAMMFIASMVSCSQGKQKLIEPSEPIVHLECSQLK